MKDIPEFYHLHYSQNIEFDVSNSEIQKVTLFLINYMFHTTIIRRKPD